MAYYWAENLSNEPIIGMATYNVSPDKAAPYFHKVACFCFEKQTLANGETMDMPLLFHLDRDLPKDIHEITLSYTLFDVTGVKKSVSSDRRGKL